MSVNQKKHQETTTAKTRQKAKPEPVNKQVVQLNQMLEAPDTLQQEEVIQAQQQFGNQVVQRAIDKKPRQGGLTDESGHLAEDISDSIQQQRGGGHPLPDNLREEASQRFHQDFDQVRLHTDDKADQLSQAINARAFTVGNDIFFKQEAYQPGTTQGRETLIHELTHVVQQSGSKSTGGRLKLGARDSAHEKEADRMSKKATPTPVAGEGGIGSTVQTSLEDEEELQMQAEDEEELQMQAEDEEELQMQTEDEEELQMQPDTAGTVQRMTVKERIALWEEKIKNGGSRQPQTQPVTGQEPAGNTTQTGNTNIQSSQTTQVVSDDDGYENVPLGDSPLGDTQQRSDLMGEIKGFDRSKLKTPEPVQKEETLQDQIKGFDRSKLKQAEPNQKPETLMDQIRGFDRSKLKTPEPVQKEETLMDQIRGFDKSNLKPTSTRNRSDMRQEIRGFDRSQLKKTETREGPDLKTRFEESSKYDIQGRRQDLINKIKDPSTSPEDAQKYSQELRTLHKNAVLPNDARGAMGTRLKSLKRQAREGKEGAYEQYQKEYGSASTYEKFLSKGAGGRTKMVAKGIGSGLWGAAKGLFGTVAKDLKTHFFGEEKKKEEKKEEKPAQSPVTVNVGGGAGAGSFEMVTQLFQENKQLKTELAKLKGEKEEGQP